MRRSWRLKKQPNPWN